MTIRSSSGFQDRSDRTESFVQAVEGSIFTPDRYFKVPTGIEYRFGEEATRVHRLLYHSPGPTTDLLRYFPDTLYFDRWRRWPTWEIRRIAPDYLDAPADEKTAGLFTFFVEYKYSGRQRKRGLAGVPAEYVGILEREAWLSYKRLSSPNPEHGTYLDGKRTLIALFYAASYAPDLMYACWEEDLEPIPDPSAIRREPAQPRVRAVDFSTGSGTPWINFDIRGLKSLARFMAEDLFWDAEAAASAVQACKKIMFPTQFRAS